jgi:predicted metalloprotease with PDZ domain
MSRLPLVLIVASASHLMAQAGAGTSTVPSSVLSAPISDVRYEVTFTRETAAERRMRVVTTFRAGGASNQPVILSLPAWTPGAYEISNFSRWILDFSAVATGQSGAVGGSGGLQWDKMDHDTWRIRRDASSPAGSQITVTFDFRADTLDNAMSWSRPDFLLFNGTNVFLYPEGRSLTFPARVTVRTETDWKVATSMPRIADAVAGAAGASRGVTFAATNYHDLVDMPFFVGEFDVDSAQVVGKWMRFATYPAGAVQGAARQLAWDQLRRAVPPQVAVFGDVPWDTYTVMQIVDSVYQGASGLEHASSHVDVLSPPFVGSEFQPSLYAHEVFHAWNVKRLRPADLWPYRYDAPMPTTWLWMSEGITDYYADLSLVRGGIIADTGFYATTAGKINEVDAVGPVALEDASLTTWVHPVDGTQYVYYPKGSLAGLMLDIAIRDASDNRRSLDNVMRELYLATYKRGRGFTRTDWWNAVSRAAGGRSFADFERKYIDGREPYPWSEILPLAGMRAEVTRVPRLGISTTADANGVLIQQVDPSGAAGAAGVRPGDYLLAIEDMLVEDPNFGVRFRARVADRREGQPLTLRVRRGQETLSLMAALRLAPGGVAISADPDASAKAVRIRNGILRGTTDP